MGYWVDSEIQKLKGEINASKLAIEAEKEIFAVKLLGGLGEDIKRELHNPTKPKIKTALIVRLSRMMQNLIDKWKRLEIKRS